MVSYRKRKKAYQTAKRKGKTYNVIEPNFRSNIYIESAEVDINNPYEVREVTRANHMLFQISHLFSREIVLKDVTKEELAWISSKEFQDIAFDINETVKMDKSFYNTSQKIANAQEDFDAVFKRYFGRLFYKGSINKATEFKKEFLQSYKDYKAKLRAEKIKEGKFPTNNIAPAQLVAYSLTGRLHG